MRGRGWHFIYFQSYGRKNMLPLACWARPKLSGPLEVSNEGNPLRSGLAALHPFRASDMWRRCCSTKDTSQSKEDFPHANDYVKVSKGNSWDVGREQEQKASQLCVCMEALVAHAAKGS